MKQLFLILIMAVPMTLIPLSAEETDDSLKCYLLTVGPGKELYLWFGHTGIIIEEADKSRFYDFGNFSFKTDHFYRNFAMGRLIYLKIGVSAKAYLNYIVTEDRDVTLQQLNIPREKILEMKEELERNILPENNTYLYHHYLDNCSTRPRDIIDRALDGQLKEATDGEADASFRSSFRRFTSHSFFPDWLLSLLQGRTIDSPITYWDSMFLPDELIKHLDTLRIKTDKGFEAAVLNKKILAKSSQVRTIPDQPPLSGVPALLYGLTAGFILMILQRLSLGQKGKTARRTALLIFLILTVFSLFGLIVWFISFFTDHLVARQNINVMMFHPLYLVPGIFLLKQSGKRLLRFWQIQGGAWILMVIVNTTFFHQDNLMTVLFFLPFLACQLLILKRPAQPSTQPA